MMHATTMFARLAPGRVVAAQPKRTVVSKASTGPSGTGQYYNSDDDPVVYSPETVYSPYQQQSERESAPRLDRWLKSGNPFDLVAMGPRAALGALKKLGDVTTEVRELQGTLNSLIQDPRPINEKPQVLIDEFSGVLARYIEDGEAAEREALKLVVQQVPAEVREQLPSDLRVALEQIEAGKGISGVYDVEVEPPSYRAGGEAYGSAPAGGSAYEPYGYDYKVGGSSSSTGGGAASSYAASSPAPAAEQPSPAESRIAAELGQVATAAAGVRQALLDLRTSEDPAQDKMLTAKIRDARTSLDGSLRAVSPSTRSSSDASVGQALAEADMLLQEVDDLLDGGY
ncbi:unnamed protein product [Pedinophyceae sp. YPF-701]|nr:unnamed protein product [Pedinophyceae sp. YPF-701]